jgi:hypothetical protein
MLQDDKKMLLSLVKEYSAVDMLSALVSAFREHRDDLSDLGLKEQARVFSDAAELVGEIRDVMKDAGR